MEKVFAMTGTVIAVLAIAAWDRGRDAGVRGPVRTPTGSAIRPCPPYIGVFSRVSPDRPRRAHLHADVAVRRRGSRAGVAARTAITGLGDRGLDLSNERGTPGPALEGLGWLGVMERLTDRSAASKER